MKKFLSFVLALIILVASASVCYADVKDEVELSSQATDDYSVYLDECSDYNTSVDTVVADITSVAAADGASTKIVSNFKGKNTVLKWNDGEGSITFTLNVPKTGLYNIALEYLLLESGTVAVDLSLLIDGKEPFKGVANISLPRLFMDDGDVRSDGLGNQFAPEQKEVFDWQEKRLIDAEGLNAKPYLFALTKGEHTVTIYSCTILLISVQVNISLLLMVMKLKEILHLFFPKAVNIP